MGFHNPRMRWKDLRGLMTGPPPVEDALAQEEHDRHRPPYRAPALVRHETATAYAELHCHSNFSFLDGASHPEELVREAYQRGLSGLALTDHDGFYGAVRFSVAAREHGLPTVFGAELSLGLPGPQNGEPDPAGRHLLLLARGQDGYHRLSAAIARAHLAGGRKGRPVYDMAELVPAVAGHVLVLTGCRKGAVPAALRTGGPDAAERELRHLVEMFGAGNVVVELTDHDTATDHERNTALAELAATVGLTTVATNNVHHHRPSRWRLGTALAAVRARRSLDEMDGWLPPSAAAYLRDGDEMAARFADFPGAVARSVEIAADLAFDLRLVAPELPDFPVPPGHTEMSWLRKLADDGWRERYRGRDIAEEARRTLDHELDIIQEMRYPGYFLVVHEIVKFCHDNGILCQGRGSAANSAVCYAIGITNVDAVKQKLLFERFLSKERDGPPDIDIDIESGRREEVIQHVFDRYGRERTAQVANVISYRPKSAVRDVAKALGFSPGQQDAWSRRVSSWESVPADEAGLPAQVARYAQELLAFPRHLGIHSGGMVICARPVIEVVPVEWATMPGRTVLQWDKDDCAEIDLTKFDLLGLGMLSALRYAREFVTAHHGFPLDLAKLDGKDKEVYEMLCRADSVGVFQVESRAQMATLPRLKPREFYDLVVEVALIRPGPIQGGSVHPYIARANGEEAPDPPHEKVREVLERTKGVPLFQEQLMQMAMAAADFTPAEADELRRAMGAKRSEERIGRLRERLFDGMARNGITGPVAEDLYRKLLAFAHYGFPESHAISFAHLVYSSAWIKRYYPAAFCAALLKAQPMGFYSPQTLCDDARRHGVTVLRPCVNTGGAAATLSGTGPRAGRKDTPPGEWGSGGPAVRLGLSGVRTIGTELAERIEASRYAHGPFRDQADLSRRVGLTRAQLEALATAGACDCFGVDRRAALWAAGPAAQERPDRLPGTNPLTAPPLPGMTDLELMTADVWATGVDPDGHPARFVRADLARRGAVPVTGLASRRDGTAIRVGGTITHRQRPATAGGVTFLNVEDETGMVNVVCPPEVVERCRRTIRESPAVVVHGKLENASGVVNVVAAWVEPLPVPVATRSRDFR